MWIKDKQLVLKEIVKGQGCTLGEVIYIGNGFDNLSCLNIVGFGACPANAQQRVKMWLIMLPFRTAEMEQSEK